MSMLKHAALLALAACGSAGGRAPDAGNTSLDAASVDARSGDAGPGCTIAGSWYADATLDPADACRRCDVAVSTTDWTDLADGTSCSAGMSCAAGWCGDQTAMVASDVKTCAINATDVFCFASTSGTIWDESKAGGAQTTVASAFSVISLAADASYVIALEYGQLPGTPDPSTSIEPFRVPVTGGSLQSVAMALQAELYANPIVLLDPSFYFVAGSSADIRAMDVTQTTNSWTSIDTTDGGELLSSDGNAIVYVKDRELVPGNLALPADFNAGGVGADQDDFYVAGNSIATAGLDALYKISRADGTVQLLASSTGNTFSWGNVYVGGTYVYWLVQSGLLRVNKHGGPTETISSASADDVMLDEQTVWWVGGDHVLYRRPQ
jgi:hypothetical protein